MCEDNHRFSVILTLDLRARGLSLETNAVSYVLGRNRCPSFISQKMSVKYPSSEKLWFLSVGHSFRQKCCSVTKTAAGLLCSTKVIFPATVPIIWCTAGELRVSFSLDHTEDYKDYT